MCVESAPVPGGRLAVRPVLLEQMEIDFGIHVPEENSTQQLLGQIRAHTRGGRGPPGIVFNTRGGTRRCGNAFLLCQRRQTGGT